MAKILKLHKSEKEGSDATHPTRGDDRTEHHLKFSWDNEVPKSSRLKAQTERANQGSPQGNPLSNQAGIIRYRVNLSTDLNK